MGQIIDITEENLDELKEYLGEDIAENIGREYYNGITSMNPVDGPEAAIVWCIRKADSFDDTESEICFFSSDDEEGGEELLEEYAGRIADDNVVRSFFEFEEIREEAYDLLNRDGFGVEKKEGRNIKVKLGDISKMKFAAKKKTPPYIVSLEKLSQLQFRQGVTNCMFSGRTGLNEDLTMLPVDWYDTEISACMITDGKINGFFLIHRTASGVLVPVLLFASGVNAGKDILNLLRFSVNAAAENYPPDTKVLICRHDKKTEELAAYLFPGKKGMKVYCGERAEG